MLVYLLLYRGMEFLALASVAPFSLPTYSRRRKSVSPLALDEIYLCASGSFPSSAVIASGLSGPWAVYLWVEEPPGQPYYHLILYMDGWRKFYLSKVDGRRDKRGVCTRD